MTLERKHPRTVSVHKCKTEKNVYSWPNIEKQLAKTVAKVSQQNSVHLIGTRTGHHMHQILLVKTLVSPLLFNFMAWMLGFSDDPEDTDYIELDDQTTSKDFSLCQDLVYISNRGKVQTPKSLAMTVQQTFGCSGLIFKILSGFGHCLSLSLAMAYDSAIAQATINTSTLFQ